MQYTPDDFFRLATEIEEQGGAHLDEVCEDRYFKLSGEKQKGVEIGYCNDSAIFEVPYVGRDKNGRDMPVQPVKICAVDDAVGRWPRFAHTIEDEESG